MGTKEMCLFNVKDGFLGTRAGGGGGTDCTMHNAPWRSR